MHYNVSLQVCCKWEEMQEAGRRRLDKNESFSQVMQNMREGLKAS